MKGFIFRLCAIVLILTALISEFYIEALSYRKEAFRASNGDIIYDSMLFTDITACSSADGKDQLVVGGTVYPENNRNAPKNVFFKLYNESGNLIATSGINEIDCSLLLNCIEKTPYGFVVICEVESESGNYGKVYKYSHNGKFIESIVINYSDQLPQEAGTKYGISITETTTYYTAIDSEKTVCTDSEGKYLLDVENPVNSSVRDASVTDEVIYTTGSFYDKNNVPKAYINAFNMSNSAFMWSRKELITKAGSPGNIYSQTEEMTIVTEDGIPVSILMYGKYFDAEVYKNYLNTNNLQLEESIDTIAKKSLQRDFLLYRTGRTKADYVKSPYTSAFLLSADISGDIKNIDLYEADSKKSISSVSFGSSSTLEIEEFSACMVTVNSVRTDSETFGSVIKGIDGNLNEVYSATVTEPTTHKTFYASVSDEKFFTFTTLNTSDKYTVGTFTAKQYKEHICKLSDATDDILFVRKIFSLIPITIMFSLMYILVRLRSLKHGITYIPKNILKRLKAKK